jgi:hypothetical protein
MDASTVGRPSDQADPVGDLARGFTPSVHVDCVRAISLHKLQWQRDRRGTANLSRVITLEKDFAIQGLGPEIQKTPV